MFDVVMVQTTSVVRHECLQPWSTPYGIELADIGSKVTHSGNDVSFGESKTDSL